MGGGRVGERKWSGREKVEWEVRVGERKWSGREKVEWERESRVGERKWSGREEREEEGIKGRDNNSILFVIRLFIFSDLISAKN